MIVDSKSKMDFVKHNFTPVKNKLLTKKSVAETHFQELLKNANLYFIREKGNFKYNTRWCYYDFFIPYYRIYVEIDGSSHNNDEQKRIDKEKTKLVQNKQRFLVRFTNEEVLSMREITIDFIIDKLAQQLSIGRHPNRDYKERILKNIRYNHEQAINDMYENSNYPIDESRPVYLYDNYTGMYFMFDNIMEAKLNTQMSINSIFDLLYNRDYRHSPTKRRYIFGWSKEECEENIEMTKGRGKTVTVSGIDYKQELVEFYSIVATYLSCERLYTHDKERWSDILSKHRATLDAEMRKVKELNII